MSMLAKGRSRSTLGYMQEDNVEEDKDIEAQGKP